MNIALRTRNFCHTLFSSADSSLFSIASRKLIYREKYPVNILRRCLRLRVLISVGILFITSPKTASSLAAYGCISQAGRAETTTAHLSKLDSNLSPLRILCFLFWRTAKTASSSIELVSKLNVCRISNKIRQQVNPVV